MEQSFGPAIAAIAALILVAGPLAVGVTKVTDLVRNAFDKADSWPSWVWNVIPIALGIAVCVGWGINLLEAVVAAVPALSDQAGTQQELGEVLTGVVVGAMAGFWHDKLLSWTTWAKGTEPPPEDVVVLPPEHVEAPVSPTVQRQASYPPPKKRGLGGSKEEF